MFQSPLHYCRQRDIWVALDMSVRQCRAMHACALPCPYEALFAAVYEEHKLVVARCKGRAPEREAARG